MWNEACFKKDICFGVGKQTFTWEDFFFFYENRREPNIQETFYQSFLSKLKGNVSKVPLRNVDGLHCPEKYLSLYPKTLQGIKDESEPFSSLLLVKYHGNCRKYLCRTNTGALRCSCSCGGASTTKADDALSHWCNQNLHPFARDLKQAQQQQESSLEKSQLCPQAPLFFAHLPVKTSEPRLISNGIRPNPHISLTHTYMPLHTPIPTSLHRILRHASTWSSGVFLGVKLKWFD